MKKQFISLALLLLFAAAAGGGEKRDALEKMREARSGKTVRGSWLPQQDSARNQELLDADGAFRDLREFEAKVRKENLTQKEFDYNEPQRSILRMTSTAFARLWDIALQLRDGKIPSEKQAEVREALHRGVVRYGELETDRLSTHAGRWHDSCFRIPTAAVNIYFADFETMKKVERGEKCSPSAKAANQMLKKVAFQAWKEPLRRDATDRNIISPERFRKNTFYVGGNALSYRPLLESALVCSSPQMVEVVAEVALRSLETISQSTADSAFWNEGFTADGSGWGHGRQNLVWGYPVDGASGAIGILQSLKGTPWGSALPRTAAQALLNFIRGSSWYYYKGRMAPWVSRDTMRSDYGNPVKIRTAYFADRLLANWPESFTPEERAELKRFRSFVTPGPIVMPGFAPGIYDGIRVFYNNDDVICKNPDYYMMLNMASFRADGLESGSQGYNMFSNDGTTVFQRKGDELFRVFGAFSPEHTPGVTARLTGTLEPGNDWNGYCSKADFAVGVTDGSEDFAAGVEFDKYDSTWKYSEWKRKQKFGKNPRILGVRARKAAFKFGGEFLFLGCGISDTAPRNGGVIATTVEQAPVAPDFLKVDEKTVRNNQFVYAVLNGSTGKVKLTREQRPLTPEKFHLSNRKTTGNIEVFQLWIEHGAGVQDAAYIYGVSVSGKVPDAWPAVLANTPNLQAAASPDGKRIGAIFYDGSARLRTGWGEVTVSAPCGVLLREKGKELEVIAADPKQDAKLERLIVTVGKLRFELEPPAGLERGKAVRLRKTLP